MRWELAADSEQDGGIIQLPSHKDVFGSWHKARAWQGPGKNGETRWKATSSDSGKRCQWLSQVVAVEIKRSIFPYAREELRMTPRFLAEATKLRSV